MPAQRAPRPRRARRVGKFDRLVSEVPAVEIIDAQTHGPQPVRPLGARYKEDVQFLLGTEMAREAMDSVGVDIALVNSRQEVCDYAVARYPDRFAGCPLWDNRIADADARVAGFRQRPGITATASTSPATPPRSHKPTGNDLRRNNPAPPELAQHA